MNDNQFRCDECGSSFSSQAELDQHYGVAHSQFRCETCGEMFNSETELEEHTGEMHSETVR
jgi:transcription elongation factor Elf1